MYQVNETKGSGIGLKGRDKVSGSAVCHCRQTKLKYVGCTRNSFF